MSVINMESGVAMIHIKNWMPKSRVDIESYWTLGPDPASTGGGLLENLPNQIRYQISINS